MPIMLSLFLFMLTACSTDPVLLRHHVTGKTVQCGPYAAFTAAENLSAVDHERGCVQDYQRQGYERVMH
jgi:hypothetical protein